ncbi:TPA: hypothetical protein DEP34_01430 [Candidatus Uhrbacteria bacterium]|nr:hypothetical protein [Candidatus Uhrbacteria bacterium]HCB19030.1 hypothetical protein [Candidatus Uhrbacteria bacterium]
MVIPLLLIYTKGIMFPRFSVTTSEAGVHRPSEIRFSGDSVSSVRDSLPKEHRAHFETLRQEIIDFTKAHGISKDVLTKPDLLREAACKLSTPDLKRLATLLERFEYLLKHKEPSRELFLQEALEYAHERYRLQEQYDAQVELLKQAGILHPKQEQPPERAQRLSSLFRSLVSFGKKQRTDVTLDVEAGETPCITGMDGKEYPVPTMEQIAEQLYRDREKFSAESDQGFRKILLVPFGMSLQTLLGTFENFLLSFQRSHPDFGTHTDSFLYGQSDKLFGGADGGMFPKLVYYPRFFDGKKHGGKTKAQILKEQATSASSFPGWHILLFQPSSAEGQDQDFPKGIALVPRREKKSDSFKIEEGVRDYLAPIRAASLDPHSPHFFKPGLTVEDWLIAFMTHLKETEEPMDNSLDDDGSVASLPGAFFPSLALAPFALWYGDIQQVYLSADDPSFPCRS